MGNFYALSIPQLQAHVRDKPCWGRLSYIRDIYSIVGLVGIDLWFLEIVGVEKSHIAKSCW